MGTYHTSLGNVVVGIFTAWDGSTGVAVSNATNIISMLPIDYGTVGSSCSMVFDNGARIDFRIQKPYSNYTLYFEMNDPNNSFMSGGGIITSANPSDLRNAYLYLYTDNNEFGLAKKNFYANQPININDTFSLTGSGNGYYDRFFAGLSPMQYITDNDVTITPTVYSYDGTEHEPAVTVMVLGELLVKDTDYTVTYSDNVEVGNAMVTVTGIGLYMGTVNKTFEIVPATIRDNWITLRPNNFLYDGHPKLPFITVAVGDTTLQSGEDYDYDIDDSVGPGVATVTVTGLGNYRGTATATYTIYDDQSADPYEEGGTSEPSDSEPDFDGQSSTIPDSTTPTLTLVDTKFARVYNPSLSQLQTLAAYMWTDQTFIDTIVNAAKKMLENPIESIISLHLLPCAVTSGNAEEVKVLLVPTGVYMPPASEQFVNVDCGSVTLKERYGSALDYSPYTQVSCFLPYIGTTSLDVDEVMNKTISIKYRVDVVTGMCVAKILVNGDVMYQFAGHCAVSLPVVSADFSTYISAFVQAAKGVATVAGGAAGLAAAKAAELAAEDNLISTVVNGGDNNAIDEADRILQAARKHNKKALAKFGDSVKNAAVNTVGAVMGAKTIVQHSGGFAGPSGYLGIRRPYLIVKRPRMCNPETYGKYNGRPCMMKLNLGSCKGYTEVQAIQLTEITATNPELSELGGMLRRGVVF